MFTSVKKRKVAIEVNDMIDGHVHIERGNYNVEWINEFVRYAVERELSEIYLLEHSHRFIEFKDIYQGIACYDEYQKSWISRRMSLSLETYKNLISEIRKLEYPINIKFGLEVCYIEGAESIIRNVLDGFDWDFVTGSVHWIDGWGFDHKKEFWDGKDINQSYIRYYEIMKSLIKSGLFSILAHPDSIKCFGYYPAINLSDTYMEIANLLKEYNMFAEQSAGLCINYGYPDLGMNKEMLEIFKGKNVRMITVSDAHRPEDVGRFIKELMLK